MRKLSCLLLSLLLLTGCIRATAPSAEEIALPSDISSEITLPADISSEISDEAEDSPTEDDLPAQPDDQPQATSFLRLAYLPVNAVPAQTDSLLSDYREQLAALDAVILNTGVYWNQDGELAISSEWLQTVQTLQPTIDLWCTVNPKGALIREGAAGQTLATEEQREALAQTVADFADEYQLSGIDIDWEFPQPEEWQDFADFLTRPSSGTRRSRWRFTRSRSLCPSRKPLCWRLRSISSTSWLMTNLTRTAVTAPYRPRRRLFPSFGRWAFPPTS